MAENQAEQYIKIRLKSLHPSSPVPFDVYVLINGRHIHYLRAGDSLTAEKLLSFEEKAPDNFYLKFEDRPHYKKHVALLLNDDKLRSFDKATVLRESSLALVEELFESPDVEKALNESKVLINQFLDLMETEPDAMSHLIGPRGALA